MTYPTLTLAQTDLQGSLPGLELGIQKFQAPILPDLDWKLSSQLS